MKLVTAVIQPHRLDEVKSALHAAGIRGITSDAQLVAAGAHDHRVAFDVAPREAFGRDRDRRGRPLPVWQGCRLVANGELFLMNWQVRDSLDGRYLGPLPATAVIGRATPLYTDEDGDGRFVWRAPTR